MIRSFNIEEIDISKRLDIYLSEKLLTTRSQIKYYIDHILVNGEKKKLSYTLKTGDIICLNIIDDKGFLDFSPKPENIPIEIVYEDEYLIVINKKYGMSVHCSNSETSGTLVNSLLYHINDFNFLGDKTRAGIIHRLDKDTSGLIVVGKNANTVSFIQEQFKNRTVKKTYHALVVGVIKENSIDINLPIGRHPVYRKKMAVRPEGKEAFTHIKVLKRFKNHTLIEIDLKTGRTHQIRVHASYKKFPVAGDKIYSKSSSNYLRLMLHAKMLEFYHPYTKERMHFETSYPEDFENFLYYKDI